MLWRSEVPTTPDIWRVGQAAGLPAERQSSDGADREAASTLWLMLKHSGERGDSILIMDLTWQFGWAWGRTGHVQRILVWLFWKASWSLCDLLTFCFSALYSFSSCWWQSQESFRMPHQLPGCCVFHCVHRRRRWVGIEFSDYRSSLILRPFCKLWIFLACAFGSDLRDFFFLIEHIY